MYILRFNTHSKERDPSIFALFLLYLLNLLPRRRCLSSDGGACFQASPPISQPLASARRTNDLILPELTLLISVAIIFKTH